MYVYEWGVGVDHRTQGSQHQESVHSYLGATEPGEFGLAIQARVLSRPPTPCLTEGTSKEANGSWKDGSAANSSICCSCRGPTLGSQHSLCGAHNHQLQ